MMIMKIWKNDKKKRKKMEEDIVHEEWVDCDEV